MPSPWVRLIHTQSPQPTVVRSDSDTHTSWPHPPSGTPPLFGPPFPSTSPCPHLWAFGTCKCKHVDMQRDVKTEPQTHTEAGSRAAGTPRQPGQEGPICCKHPQLCADRGTHTQTCQTCRSTHQRRRTPRPSPSVSIRDSGSCCSRRWHLCLSLTISANGKAGPGPPPLMQHH